MARVSHSRRRADRIRETIPMARVLADYGYTVNPDGGDREQQFPCDLHGDGRDGKPSGRLYPSSNSMYCFACGRARDAVSLAMEKEGLKFGDALDKLERRYGLPYLPNDGGSDDDDDGPRPESVADVLSERPVPYEEASDRADRFLRRITSARALPMTDTLLFWSAFDRARHGATNEGWPDAKAAAAVDAVRSAARVAVGIADDG
jgi:CHC2 zinc finger